MRVLVVEDEPKMAGLIRRGLTEEGYAADISATGDDALWMAEAAEYDAIVLDVLLPGTNGFDVCRQLRAPGAARLSSRSRRRSSGCSRCSCGVRETSCRASTSSSTAGTTATRTAPTWSTSTSAIYERRSTGRSGRSRSRRSGAPATGCVRHEAPADPPAPHRGLRHCDGRRPRGDRRLRLLPAFVFAGQRREREPGRTTDRCDCAGPARRDRENDLRRGVYRDLPGLNEIRALRARPCTWSRRSGARACCFDRDTGRAPQGRGRHLVGGPGRGSSRALRAAADRRAGRTAAQLPARVLAREVRAPACRGDAR